MWEINGVAYHMDTKKVEDDFGLKKPYRKRSHSFSIGDDRMTRFKMKRKRKFFCSTVRGPFQFGTKVGRTRMAERMMGLTPRGPSFITGEK